MATVSVMSVNLGVMTMLNDKSRMRHKHQNIRDMFSSALGRVFGNNASWAQDFARKAQKQLMKAMGGGRVAGKKYRPNGFKECARRVRQMKAGTMTANYVHGDQYDR